MAWQALQQLLHQRLTVILIPAPDLQHSCHKVRQAVEHDPEWYSEVWSRRSSRSGMRRIVMASLRRIAIDGRVCLTGHGMDEELLEVLAEVAHA